MDSEQKYTRENSYFSFDDWFFSGMTDFSSEEIKSVMHQCRTVVNHLPILNNWPQYVAGVMTINIPKFFLVEYIKEEYEVDYTESFFLEVKEIECDEYLDYINKKLSIKTYHENKVQSGTDIKESTKGSIGVAENM